MPKIKRQCPDCSGTGLYCGFAEPKGTAVVCMGCKGKGWNYITYKEFTHRKMKSGVHTVQLSRGTFIVTGVGPVGDKMTYEQFQKEYPVD